MPGGQAAKMSVALVLSGLLVALSLVAYICSCPLPKDSGGATVYVEPGLSTRDVADLLHKEGVIRNPLFFRALARIMGADGGIQSGEYRFEPGIYAWDALRSLVRGRVVYYSLTVCEGLEVEDIASLVEERGFGTKEELIALAADRSLLPDFVQDDDVAHVRYPLEGYLFPDTYYIRKGMTVKEIVSMMLKRSNQVLAKDVRDKIRDLGLTPHEAATLASIVEREAFVPEERPTIAAVYLNRLKISMKLDADPTVVYAMGEKRGYLLLLKDLEFSSPYNTYTNPGLPPGPIGNFGKASLDAVLNPADVDYLYFVARQDGSHAFARTLSEHNDNVAEHQGD